MIYIQGITEQTRLFLLSLGFGFLLGILYDAFRTVRLILSNSAVLVPATDILYFCFCTFFNFCFFMAFDSGRLRAFVVFGEILGWLIYYISFGAVAIKITSFVVRRVRRIFSAVFSPFVRLKRKIGRKIAVKASRMKKTSQKSNKNAKFILQKHMGIVYNVLGYYKNCFLFKNRKD